MESLHPMVIHFPIALLMAAFLFESLALAFRRPSWHRIALWNLTLGTLGAIAAVITGRLAMAVAKHSPAIHQVMSLHERLGYLVLILALLLTGWRLLSRDTLSRPLRWVALSLLGITCGLMAFSAHLGGRLVYEFGVGGVYGRTSGIEVVR